MAINWDLNSRQRGPRAHGDGVTVAVNKSGLLASGEQRYAAVFRFPKECVEKLEVTSGYVVYAWVADRKRIYFKESDNVDGYKLCKNKNGYTYQISCATSYPESLSKYKGVYSMDFDRTEGYYYIDLSKPLKKTPRPGSGENK